MGTRNAETVRAMLAAHQDGRIDDLLRYLDPDVVWVPQIRPGPSVAMGHVAVRRMIEQIHRQLGRYRLELGDVTEPQPDRVQAPGRVILVRGDDEETVLTFELLVDFRAGLVVRVDPVTTEP